MGILTDEEYENLKKKISNMSEEDKQKFYDSVNLAFNKIPTVQEMQHNPCNCCYCNNNRLIGSCQS